MDTRLRASPRHGGAGNFLLNFFLSQIRRGGDPFGGGGNLSYLTMADNNYIVSGQSDIH